MPRTCAKDAKAPEPKLGDLIEIFRGAFQHWAVYVGDGNVVHLVAPGIGSSGASSSVSGWFWRGKVIEEKLSDVVDENKWKVNNILDKTHKKRQEQKIVNEARSWVGKEVWYSVSFWNCEHFATMCRYGKSRSWQVVEATGTAAVVAVTTVGGVIVAGATGSVIAVAGGIFALGRMLHQALSTSARSRSS